MTGYFKESHVNTGYRVWKDNLKDSRFILFVTKSKKNELIRVYT